MLHLQLILQTVSDQSHEEVYMLPVSLPISYFIYWLRMNRIIYVLKYFRFILLPLTDVLTLFIAALQAII